MTPDKPPQFENTSNHHEGYLPLEPGECRELSGLFHGLTDGPLTILADEPPVPGGWLVTFDELTPEAREMAEAVLDHEPGNIEVIVTRDRDGLSNYVYSLSLLRRRPGGNVSSAGYKDVTYIFTESSGTLGKHVQDFPDDSARQNRLDLLDGEIERLESDYNQTAERMAIIVANRQETLPQSLTDSILALQRSHGELGVHAGLVGMLLPELSATGSDGGVMDTAVTEGENEPFSLGSIMAARQKLEAAERKYDDLLDQYLQDLLGYAEVSGEQQLSADVQMAIRLKAELKNRYEQMEALEDVDQMPFNEVNTRAISDVYAEATQLATILRGLGAPRIIKTP